MQCYFEIYCNVENKDRKIQQLVCGQVLKESIKSLKLDLFLAAAVEMVQMMIGEKELVKFKTTPLSNNIIKRRINDMAENIRIEIIENITKCGLISLYRQMNLQIYVTMPSL